MSTEPVEITEFDDTTEAVPAERGTLARRGIIAAAAGGLAAAMAAVRSAGGGSSADGTLVAASGNTPASPDRQAAPAPAVAPRQVAEPTAGDLDIAAVAAALEVLAVNTYGAALDAAGSGALGDVPPAVGEFATTAKAHHEAARDAWNGVLTAAGRPAVTAPPADLEATVNEQFGMVTDAGGAAQLALTLEQIAAATYLKVLGVLESKPAIDLAGSIQPIDRQHVAVLLFALGMYPVPEVFASVDQAYAGNGQPAAGAPMMPETR